jgi:integrase
MSTVRFNLKDNTDINKDTLINLIYRFSGKRLKYSTGQKIKPKNWNENQQRAKNIKQFPQAAELNALLDKLEHTTLTAHRKFINDDKLPTLEDLKKELDSCLFKSDEGETTEAPKPFMLFFDELINERKESPKFALGTIKNYRTAYNHLSNYQKQKRITIDFDNIDLDFFNSYTNYLYALKYSTNYVSKLIRNIKTVIQEATERGINANMRFKSKKFRVSGEDAKNIYLTLDELETLHKLDLSQNYRLEKVRDLFLVGCFTGLRFSDFTNIKPEHLRVIDGVQVIDIFTQKTKEPVTIPIHPKVKEVFAKYRNAETILPRTLSNQKMNQYLKELGALANINEEIMVTISVGGKHKEDKKIKYEMISTHTARRSFATNAFKSGIPAISIMKITGHKTQASFMQYIKINNEENAVLMAKNAFFQ